MDIKKEFAKRIMIAPPPSVEYNFLSSSLSKASIREVDVVLQNWVLVQSDFFSEEDWREVQLKKLKGILVHAGRNVPYWQKLFKKINFIPEKIQSVYDLGKIPVTTRTDFKKIPREELIARNIPRRRFVEAHTSGSTGEPLSFFQDARDVFRRYINTLQELRYAGADADLKKILILGLDSHHDLDAVGMRFSLGEALSGLENKRKRFDVLYPFVRSRGSVLITTGSILKRFAFLVARDGARLNFEKIFYRGEFLNKKDKHALSLFFGCELFTTYGSRECSLLGIECASHKLHAAPWMNLTEITDKNGHHVPVNTSGNIVATFLENYAMPFIRYQVGDTGVIKDTHCRCGRDTSIIEFDGRESIFVNVPDGESVPLLAVTKKIDENYGGKILQYQFEENDSSTLVFRYASYGRGTKADEEALRTHFDKYFNHKIRVIVQRVEEISPNRYGKTPVFVRRSSHTTTH